MLCDIFIITNKNKTLQVIKLQMPKILVGSHGCSWVIDRIMDHVVVVVYCLSLAVCCYSKLMDKLRYVFEQVMITDGTRKLPDAFIGKTFRVCNYVIYLL